MRLLLLAIALISVRVQEAENAAAFEKIRAEASRGTASAQLELAEEYLEGRFVAVDEARALELVRAAADAGLRRAKFELAEMYACGMGEPRNNSETPFRLYMEAANNGWGDAMLQLARRYRFGLGTEQNLREAAHWTCRAIGRTPDPTRDFLNEQGDPLPQLTPEDRAFATILSGYFKAWRTADPAALLQIGRAFLNGKAEASAAFWLSFAARRGNAEATNLAKQARDKLPREQLRELDEELSKIEADRQFRRLQRQ